MIATRLLTQPTLISLQPHNHLILSQVLSLKQAVTTVMMMMMIKS